MSSFYRIFKAHDGITSPQFLVMTAANGSQDPRHEIHEWLDNETLADVYHGRKEGILDRQSLNQRKV